MSDDIKNLGPLAPLAGVWEGVKGNDESPDPDRTGVAYSSYRERLTLTPIGQVNNHEQCLYGLRYSTTVWRLEEDEAFHEEVGYWLWDGCHKQVIKSFCVPRGYTVIAGGTAEPDAKSMEMIADVGSETYGICSNQWIANEFKTVRYELRIEVHDANSFSYEQDTVIKIKNQSELFHHTDKNTLTRVE